MWNTIVGGNQLISMKIKFIHAEKYTDSQGEKIAGIVWGGGEKNTGSIILNFRDIKK